VARVVPVSAVVPVAAEPVVGVESFSSKYCTITPRCITVGRLVQSTKIHHL
jgi:hypothetical protein